MTRRLTTVPYDLSPEPDREDRFTGFNLGSEATRVLLGRPYMVHKRISRRFAYRLIPTSGAGKYDTSAVGIIKQGARGGSLTRSWIAAELMYAAPTGTTVQARLHDGAGVSWYWRGAAWAVAGATNWNTPAEVEANFSTVAPADLPKVGIEWRLVTTDSALTPSVYGAAIAAGLGFGARTGTTIATTLSDGWADDVIHRVVIPWLQGLEPERTDERTASGATAIVNYASGVGQLCRAVIKNATAAYNLTDDPEMMTEVATTWASATKILTFTTPIPDGERFAVRLILTPTVVFGGSADLFVDGVPQITIESVDEIREGPSRGNYEIIRDTTAETALQIPAGSPKTYAMTLLIQATGYVSALEVVGALERAMDGRDGLVVVSPGTGIAVGLVRNHRIRPARTNVGVEGAARIDLIAKTVEYHGTSSTVKLIVADGVQPTIYGSTAV